MTGATGMKHTKLMLGDGTEVVGGVNPRKAGTSVDFDGNEVPVFGTVKEAIEKTGANVSVIFVPEKFTKDAVVEAIDAEIPLAVVITEGIAVHDSAAFWSYAGKKGNKTRIIGRTAPASSRRASPTSASSRATSPSRAASAWSRSPAR